MYPGMVRASSLMRSTAAAYSSRSSGLTRVRKTVISIGWSPLLRNQLSPYDRDEMEFVHARSSLRRRLLRQLPFRFAIKRADLDVIFGVIFFARQFLRRPVLGIGLPGALSFFVCELDDGDALAIVGVKV